MWCFSHLDLPSNYLDSFCFLGEGNGNPLQYSCLENPMDGGAWWAAVHGVTRSGTRLSDFTFTFHFHALEKEMETHSSILAYRIPGMGKPGGLLSMGVAQSRTRLTQLSSSSSSLDRSPFIGPRRGIPNLVFFYKDRHENWACPNPSTM